MPVADASPEALGDLITGLDAVITFSRELGRQHYWPAIDPTRSTSRLLEDDVVGAERRELAVRVREMIESGDSDAVRRLREFLAQPFSVAEPYTGREGTRVPLEEAIETCQSLISMSENAL